MKKTAIIFLSILIINTSARAFSVEAGGGLQMISDFYNYGLVVHWNSNYYTVKEYEEYMASLGASGEILETSGAPAVNIKTRSIIGDYFSIHARVLWVPGLDYNALYTDPITLRQIEQDIKMSLFYAGAGLGVNLPFSPVFSLFLEGDIGYTMTGASVNQELRDQFGNVLAAQNEEALSGSYIGYFAGAGLRINITTGFFACVEANYNNMGNSVYAGLSLGLDLGEKKPAKSGTTDVSGFGYVTRHEKYGDYYFKKKQYKKAYKYYKYVLKQGKTAALYRKIGNCFYALGMKKEAFPYYRRSLKMKFDPRLRQFIKRVYGR